MNRTSLPVGGHRKDAAERVNGRARLQLEPLESRVMLSANFTIQFVQDQLPDEDMTLIPGDKGTLAVVVTNIGDTAGTGVGGIHLYLSSDQTVSPATDYLAGRLPNQSLAIAPGKSRVFRIAAAVPGTVPPGDYYIVAELKNPAPLATTSTPATVDVAWLFGNVPDGDVTRNAKLTLTDADGTVAVFSLSGPGTGQVTPAGNGVLGDLVVTGTNAQSSVTITTQKPAKGDLINNGIIELGNVTLNGALKALKASTTLFSGALNAAQTLGALTFGTVNATAIQIAGAAVPTAFTFGRVLNLDLLQSNAAIKSLSATEWLDQDREENRDTIRSPLVQAVATKGDAKTGLLGDFSADILATEIGKITVTGWLKDAVLLATGNVGMNAVAVGGIQNSMVYAGLTEGTTGLPAPAEFGASTATIKSFAIKGIKSLGQFDHLFVNSCLAAPNLGSVKLLKVQRANGGTQHGVAALDIKSLSTKQPDGNSYSWGKNWDDNNWVDFTVFEYNA